MTRINFGCGTDYRDGWINVDVAEETKWQSGGRKPDIMNDDANIYPGWRFENVLKSRFTGSCGWLTEATRGRCVVSQNGQPTRILSLRDEDCFEGKDIECKEMTE